MENEDDEEEGNVNDDGRRRRGRWETANLGRDTPETIGKRGPTRQASEKEKENVLGKDRPPKEKSSQPAQEGLSRSFSQP